VSDIQSKLGGSGDCGLSIVSPDGRYVLFASTANNLTLTNNNLFVLPSRFNVLLRDNLGGITTLVSANQAGTGGGNGDSFPTGISTNGQFALFESSASDLVANDTNNVSDIFVHDLVNGTTRLVSIGTGGGNASGVSRGSVITPDGRYVAFVSAATNLVSGDTNSIADVFVRDLSAGTTRLASVGAITNANPPSMYVATSSESPEITPDGRYVVFYSTATNLVAGVKTAGEIYVRDLVAGNTIWASTNARAIFKSVTGGTNIASCNYSISDDGQFVAFEACTNFSGASPRGIILRYSLPTGLTDVINTNDENEYSINDGYFVSDPAQGNAWQDIPASRHDGGCVLSYADGHSEMKRWTDTKILNYKGTFGGLILGDPNSSDAAWLQARATFLIK
jgi:prepilin-type processing-associated H-X9-DG protein